MRTGDIGVSLKEDTSSLVEGKSVSAAVSATAVPAADKTLPMITKSKMVFDHKTEFAFSLTICPRIFR